MDEEEFPWENNGDSVIIIALDCLITKQETEVYDLYLQVVKNSCKKFGNLLAQCCNNTLVSLVELCNKPKHLIQIGKLDHFLWHSSLETLELEPWNHLKHSYSSLLSLLKAIITAYEQLSQATSSWTLILITPQLFTINKSPLNSVFEKLDSLGIKVEIQLIELGALLRHIGPDLILSNPSDTSIRSINYDFEEFVDMNIYCRDKFEGVVLYRYSHIVEQKLYLYFKQKINQIVNSWSPSILLEINENLKIQCRLEHSLFPSPYLGRELKNMSNNQTSRNASKILTSKNKDTNYYTIQIGDAVLIQSIPRSNYFPSFSKTSTLRVVHKTSIDSISELTITGKTLVLVPEQKNEDQQRFKYLFNSLKQRSQVLIVSFEGKLKELMKNENVGQLNELLKHFYLLSPSANTNGCMYLKELITSEQVLEEKLDIEGICEIEYMEQIMNSAVDMIPEYNYNPHLLSSGYHETIERLLENNMTKITSRNQKTVASYKMGGLSSVSVMPVLRKSKKRQIEIENN